MRPPPEFAYVDALAACIGDDAIGGSAGCTGPAEIIERFVSRDWKAARVGYGDPIGGRGVGRCVGRKGCWAVDFGLKDVRLSDW